MAGAIAEKLCAIALKIGSWLPIAEKNEPWLGKCVPRLPIAEKLCAIAQKIGPWLRIAEKSEPWQGHCREI